MAVFAVAAALCPSFTHAQVTYSGSYSNVWSQDSGSFTPASPYNFAEYSFGGSTNNGQVDGRLLTTDGSLGGTAQSLNVGQVLLINMGGQTGGGRSGITTGGRVGFALYSGTDIYNGGSSNALGRVTSDSLLRVEYVGGGANTAIVGGSTFGGPDFADFKDGEYYRVTILSDKQFTISYGDSSSTTEFTYNMSDLAGSGGTIQRLAVYNLGANMDALFGPIVVSNASYLNFSNNTAEFKDITGVVGNNGATTNAVVKNGAGTVTFSANNTYGGATTISNGVLNLNTTGGGAAAGATTSVAVHSGATLIISQNEQINNAADVTLSGGTIRRGSGVSETMGNLTLTTASTLDFGTGSTGTLSFGTYTPSSLLTVSNFLEGNVLTFKSDLTSTINNGSLFSISNAFSYNWDGGSSTFTITAIPETSTMVAALGLAGMFLWPARRRLLRDAKSVLGLRPPARDRFESYRHS
ncbi:MAG: autotransporter-associated beta strand repeat-containing protein [Chthoniobacterales bacterium]|nr:autotransporter-associated beta strand repeat-containing protein [Chthoniobacterales bacterium]